MSEGKILVYRIGADPIELLRTQCHTFSRTELLTGQACPEKRRLNYKWGGKGVESSRTSDDLTLGSAVHWGLERMLTSEVEDVNHLAELGADAARAQFLEDAEANAESKEEDLLSQLLPETAQLLVEEQAALAYALVWTFGKRRLASLLERFEVVDVEPEINWYIGYGEYVDPVETDDGAPITRGKHIVMMSRPDAILRSKEDGKLWTVSWKTAKRFGQDYLERLECDVQSITEGLAVQAKYGVEPGGTFYSYFLKGDRLFDEASGAKRYNTFLVRPYTNWSGVGEPQYKAVYQWTNETGEQKRLGKGWARTDIWKGGEMAQWLELLDNGQVQPEAGRDWLSEVVAEPLLQPFKPDAAKRWIESTIVSESDWIKEKVRAMHTGNCFIYNRPCTYFNICHRGDTVERQLAAGLKKWREPNHKDEQSQGEE